MIQITTDLKTFPFIASSPKFTGIQPRTQESPGELQIPVPAAALKYPGIIWFGSGAWTSVFFESCQVILIQSQS